TRTKSRKAHESPRPQPSNGFRSPLLEYGRTGEVLRRHQKERITCGGGTAAPSPAGKGKTPAWGPDEVHGGSGGAWSCAAAADAPGGDRRHRPTIRGRGHATDCQGGDEVGRARCVDG